MKINLRLSNLVTKHILIIFTAFAVISSLVIGIIQLGRPMNSEFDAYRRLNTTFQYFLDGHGNILGQAINNPYLAWPPFSSVLLGIPFFFTKEYVLIRAFVLVFGLLSLPLTAYYTSFFTKHNGSIMVAVFLVTVFPLRLLTQATTLTEPLYVVLLLCCFCLFLTDRPWSHITGLIFLNFLQGMRYEYSIVVIWYWFFLFFRSNAPRAQKIFFSLLAIVEPIWWISRNVLLTGTPAAFLIQRYQDAQLVPHPEYFHVIPSILLWTRLSVGVISLPVIICYFIGLIRLWPRLSVDKKILSVFPLIFLCVFIIVTFSGLLESYQARYLLALSILAAPLVSGGFIEILRVLFRIANRTLVLMSIFVYITVWYLVFWNSKILASAQYNYPNQATLQITSLANALIKDGDFIKYENVLYITDSKNIVYKAEKILYLINMPSLFFNYRSCNNKDQLQEKIVIIENPSTCKFDLTGPWEKVYSNNGFAMYKYQL